ncbi:MAG: phosphoribosyltransferase [Chloroflexota bacterium]
MTERRLKRILGWEEIVWYVEEIIDQIPTPDYDLLLVITRGGMVPACLISERMNLRNIVVAAVQFHRRTGESLQMPVFWQFPDDEVLRDRSVLVVDDVWTSGNTAVTVRNRVREIASQVDVAVLHYKPSESHFESEEPDFFAEMTDDWVIYPWDSEDHSRSGE